MAELCPPKLNNSISDSALLENSQHLHSDEEETQNDTSVCASTESLSSPVPILEGKQEQTIARLQAELTLAQDEIRLKDDKCDRLTKMQKSVDKEIHELTEHLFQEAYRMVQEANQKRVHAEKLLRESKMKIDGLQAEVDALKILVINSTPGGSGGKRSSFVASGGTISPDSTPGKRAQSSPRNTSTPRSKFSFLGHRRNNSDTPSSVYICSECQESQEEKELKKQIDFKEVDPVYHREFASWREKQDLEDTSHPFLKRVYDEDINPCFNFEQRELAVNVLRAIEQNTIVLEPVRGERPSVLTCSLSCVPRICPYRLRVDNGTDWLHISQLCRNRIAAVCDFFTYLRYLNQGIVKCGVHEAYWQVVRLRKNMAVARLGFGFYSSS